MGIDGDRVAVADNLPIPTLASLEPYWWEVAAPPLMRCRVCGDVCWIEEKRTGLYAHPCCRYPANIRADGKCLPCELSKKANQIHRRKVKQREERIRRAEERLRMVTR